MPRQVALRTSSNLFHTANLLHHVHHAAFAADLLGHLDEAARPELSRQRGDRVEPIAHELTELLGHPSALAGPDDRKAPGREHRHAVRPPLPQPIALPQTF